MLQVMTYPSTEFIANYIKRQQKWKQFKMDLACERSKAKQTTAYYTRKW